MGEEFFRSRIVWSTQPSLKQVAAEVGVDYSELVDRFAVDKNDMEIAEEFGVSTKVINHLRDHFERYGLGSIMGQD